MSMLEYLADLRRYGHEPTSIGTVRIGRTVYCVGEFVTPERPAPAGSRAAAEGRPVPSETRRVISPMYRTDWVTRDSAGPVPAALPAAYRHAPNLTIFEDAAGALWYVAGWSNPARGDWVWLNRAEWMNGAPGYDEPRRVVQMVSEGPTESFQSALRLAGPAVLARVAERAATS
jgi:hypothetical protein